MAKFWNFFLFQLGWFACVWGAANQQVLWAVVGTGIYLLFHVARSCSPKLELSLLFKAVIYGVSADTLLIYSGLLDFKDAWPSLYISPVWMWVLWALVASTINGPLSWLRGKPVLGAFLGGICGPMSYEAGIRMGAGSWAGNIVLGWVVVGVIWAIAIPLMFYWDRTPLEQGLVKNP